MSFTTYSTAVAGSILTAAFWNQQVRDNGNVIITSIETSTGRISGEIKNFSEEITTLTISAGAITLDLSLSNDFKVTLNANITSISISNWVASKYKSIRLRLTQDGTGSRTVALPAGWKWSHGSAPTITATANKTDIIVLDSDDGGTTIFAARFIENA